MDQWIIESALESHPEISEPVHNQWTRPPIEWYIDWVQMENLLRDIISSVEREKMSPITAIVLFQEVIRSFTHREFTDDGSNDRTTE